VERLARPGQCDQPGPQPAGHCRCCGPAPHRGAHCLLGRFLLLANAVEPAQARGLHFGWTVALAAAAFASAAGLSIWVTTGAVVTVGAWTAVLAYEAPLERRAQGRCGGRAERCRRASYLIDVLHNRAYGSAPIELAVLSSPFIDGVFEPACPPACASGGAATCLFHRVRRVCRRTYLFWRYRPARPRRSAKPRAW